MTFVEGQEVLVKAQVRQVHGGQEMVTVVVAGTSRTLRLDNNVVQEVPDDDE